MNDSDIVSILLGLPILIQFIIICATYYILKFVLFVLPNRILRTIKVCNQGWPPSHLDADGDWKPEGD